MSLENYLVSENEKKQFQESGYLYLDQQLFSASDYLILKSYMFSFLKTIPSEVRGGYFTSSTDYKPNVNDWVASPAILNIVKQFLGPNIIFFNIACCYKAPFSQSKVSVHTDAHYWRLEKMLDPVKVFILFIPFSDMEVDSGCLQVIPKQLSDKIYHYKKVDAALNYFGYEIDDPSVNPKDLIPIPMKENTLFLLKEDLIHASGSNNSSEHRLGVTLRFISSEINYFPSEFDKNRQMYLVSGENVNHIPCKSLSTLPLIPGFSWTKTR